MSSVGVWAALPLILLAGRVVAITNQQGLCSFFFLMPYPIFTGFFRMLQSNSASTWAKYGVYQSIVAVAVIPYVTGVVWITSNARTPTQRSVYSALYVMLTNAANSFATQIFRQEDRPLYLEGLIVILVLQCFAAVLLLTGYFVLKHANKHSLGDAGLPAITAQVDGADGDHETTVEKKFQYSI